MVAIIAVNGLNGHNSVPFVLPSSTTYYILDSNVKGFFK